MVTGRRGRKGGARGGEDDGLWCGSEMGTEEESLEMELALVWRWILGFMLLDISDMFSNILVTGICINSITDFDFYLTFNVFPSILSFLLQKSVCVWKM